MGRSTKKGPYVDQRLLKKIEKMNQEGKRHPIKTWSRWSDISPEMVGYTLEVHDGRRHVGIFITESMVGHKLGEFAPTRKFVAHSKKGYKKPVAITTKR